MDAEAVEGFLLYGAGLTCTIDAELEDADGGGATGGWLHHGWNPMRLNMLKAL